METVDIRSLSSTGRPISTKTKKNITREEIEVNSSKKTKYSQPTWIEVDHNSSTYKESKAQLFLDWKTWINLYYEPTEQKLPKEKCISFKFLFNQFEAFMKQDLTGMAPYLHDTLYNLWKKPKVRFFHDGLTNLIVRVITLNTLILYRLNYHKT